MWVGVGGGGGRLMYQEGAAFFRVWIIDVYMHTCCAVHGWSVGRCVSHEGAALFRRFFFSSSSSF